MADQFKSGDTVTLKSGGPVMTVEKMGNNAASELRVWCSWFDNKNELKHGAFAPAMLEPTGVGPVVA